MSSLEKCLFSSLARCLIGSFIILELSCRSCLSIFEINPLSVASFAVIFSQSEGCLFILLIVSCVMQKLLILIRSNLFLLLCPIFSEVSHRGSCSGLCWTVFCLYFPPGVLVSGLTFRSLIYFESVFVYGVRKRSSFILLQVADQFSQHHLLEIVFSPFYILVSFVEDKVSISTRIYLWAFYSVPLIYISVSVPVPYCLLMTVAL